MPQLERDVVVLAARVEYLTRFLDSSPPAALLTEIAEFEKRRDAEGATSKQFERMIARCREHLALLNGLAARRDAVCAAAEELLRTLEQMPARIVGLQLARIESCDSRSADACDEAAAIRESFSTFERAISESAAGDSSLQ